MPESRRSDLLGLPPAELGATLERHFAARGQPGYRALQVRRWIYQGDARSFAEMTDLPLAERFSIDEPEAASVARSRDGTVKHLWKLRGGEVVESVLIPAGGRLTLCLSSQAGCPLACAFCATGWSGFRGQLTPGEIVAQYRGSRRWAAEEGYPPISNVVFMGMGEPLANRKSVFPSLGVLNEGYGIGARRITVSTVGVVPGILALARRPEPFGLALSLHSPDPELRAKLIPLEKRHPLPDVLAALRTFQRRGGRRITFEYTMIRGVNDDLSLAPRLSKMAKELRAFVNLIPFNPIPHQDWRPSARGRVAAFARILERDGVSVAVREPRGRDIDAACGQLRATSLEAGESDAGPPGAGSREPARGPAKRRER